MSYAEIAASGGGIASTVRATREASEEQLLSSALKRIRCMQQDGVTTIEIKSGYGLNYENERKMLRVIRQIGEAFTNDGQKYLLSCSCFTARVQRPKRRLYRAYLYRNAKLHAEGLVDAVDAFCEHLAFSPAQVERVLKRHNHWGYR